jgi:uncharacterized protein
MTSLPAKISLPDVNVWLALSAESHTHFASAHAWFEEQLESSIAFCRVTQMGLLRLLTNPMIMGRGARSILDALDLHQDLTADPRVIFLPESDHVEEKWLALMSQPGISTKSWTDAYLAVFA